MQRYVLVFLLFFVAACASVPTVTGPGEIPYHVVTDETMKIRLPAPESWTAELRPVPISMFYVSPPSKGVELIVMLDPLALASGELLEKTRQYFKKMAPEMEPQYLTGTISGHAAQGFRATANNRTLTVFTVDHDRGIYVVLLVINKNATEQEREILDFIFQRLQIIEDEE